MKRWSCAVFVLIYSLFSLWILLSANDKFNAVWIVAIFGTPLSVVAGYLSGWFSALLGGGRSIVMDGFFVYLLGVIQYGLIGYAVGAIISAIKKRFD